MFRNNFVLGVIFQNPFSQKAAGPEPIALLKIRGPILRSDDNFGCIW